MIERRNGMKLSKFPVISRNGMEYLVTVGEGQSTVFDWWQVNVYVQKQRGLFKYKKVYEWDSGWHHYKEYIGKYKEMAIKAVEKYEQTLVAKLEREAQHNKGIEAFEQWDGQI